MSTTEEPNIEAKTNGDKGSEKKRKAGFWSVLLMVIGVQCGGMSTIWSIGATEGLKKLLLGHALVGLMYVLLAVCFAELTSVVPFGGGSFGFCRAALGPFWGFMVGASEVLENIMKVVVCVHLIAVACTMTFKTKWHFTPLFMLASYVLLLAIHLRGGSFYWNIVIILGLISIGTVLMVCIGNIHDIDVKLYGQIDNSTFDGDNEKFLSSLYTVIWVYIGLEIVPQTCERVKDVHKNLPRALVLGTLFSYGLIFWVVVTVVCIAPGYLYPDLWLANPYAFTVGFVQMFERPDLWYLGGLFAIIPLFASALTFMWGCGYQVASLARSGLVPSVFATTYGENEIPVVALSVSALVQFLMCVGNQRTGKLDGIRTCYRAMMIGATFVYIGMFMSFIVFRTNFGGMKRHWVSPVGIPGALVGLGIALILCIAVVILDPRSKALITYFVFMGSAMLYYVLYACHTQYFSKEEQKHFLKAYIVNANNAKTKTKQKTPQQKAMEAMFAPISHMFGLPTTAFSRSNGGATSASAAPSARSSSHAPVASMSKHNVVAPAPVSLPSVVEVPESPAKTEAEIRAQEATQTVELKSLEKSTEARSTKSLNAPLRASWVAASGSTKVSWSGKAMTMTESKKFLEVLMSAPADVTGQLVESLPNQFVSLGIDEAAMVSMRLPREDDDESEEREVFLEDIVEGALEDNVDTNVAVI